MNRRTVLGSMAGVMAATSFGLPASAGLRKKAETLLKPRRLETGMTIGLVAPASNSATNAGIRFAMDIVESLGFRVKPGKYLFERNKYLAGTDKQRAEDVNQMFADDQVDAIFCVRGGYGSLRILPYLDYRMIRKHPKVFLGYSDITAILNALNTRAGLVSFHGPIAKQHYTDYTLEEFNQVLMAPAAMSVIGSPPPFDAGPGKAEEANRLTRFVGGRGQGKLIGGNLSLLTKLIGTPFEPDFNQAILVLEDVGEAPYRIDGMLTQLWLGGKLQQLAGIAMGKFTDTEYAGNSFSVEAVLRQRCAPLGIPAVQGLMIGHIDDQTIVPLGIEAALDVDAGTLTLLEPAVT